MSPFESFWTLISAMGGVVIILCVLWYVLRREEYAHIFLIVGLIVICVSGLILGQGTDNTSKYEFTDVKPDTLQRIDLFTIGILTTDGKKEIYHSNDKKIHESPDSLLCIRKRDAYNMYSNHFSTFYYLGHCEQ